MSKKVRICGFYKRGHCRFGDACRFPHERSGGGEPTAAASRDAEGTATRRGGPLSLVRGSRPTITAPSITPETIVHLLEPNSDSLMPRSDQGPDATFKRIFVFLRHDFAFRSGFTVKSFCEILVSCNSKQPEWTMRTQADFLHLLIRDEAGGVQRMRDVLRFPVTTRTCAFSSTEICFQQTVLLIIMFLSSDAVLRCMAKRTQTLLIGVVDLHLERLLGIILTSTESLLDASAQAPLTSLAQIFKPTSLMLLEYLRLFKESAVENESILKPFVERFVELHNRWADEIRSGKGVGDALAALPIDEKAFALHVVAEPVKRLAEIVEHAGRKIEPLRTESVEDSATEAWQHLGQLAHMQRLFEGPGTLRGDGPRHDNDFTDIGKIKIIPTLAEMRCEILPYLPATVPSAPHHLPEGTYERLLDVQFRLLREEAVAPFRQGLSSLMKDLSSYINRASTDVEAMAGAGRIGAILAEKGGRLRSERHDVIVTDLVVHGDGALEFRGVDINADKGITVELAFRSPKRAKNNPRQYWDFATKRCRWKSSGPRSGMATRTDAFECDGMPNELVRSVSRLGFPAVKVAFFDATAPTFFLKKPKGITELLVEAGSIIYDTMAPFLQSLQAAEPHHLPFKNYLAGTFHRQLPAGSVEIEAPRYAQRPSFRFNLTPLLDPSKANEPLTMSLDASSVEAARLELERRSTFDGSQIDAVLNSLTSQVALIQGPPGTGKSFTGIALVDVLLRSKVRPILIVCVTNHALDHFLRSILDKGITNSLLRFGSFSKDPKVSGKNEAHCV
ncbi:hypothetical protein ACQY0O_000530 [Thecaphora frezii]